MDLGKKPEATRSPSGEIMEPEEAIHEAATAMVELHPPSMDESKEENNNSREDTSVKSVPEAHPPIMDESRQENKDTKEGTSVNIITQGDPSA